MVSGFAVQAVTTEDNVSQLDAETLDLTAYPITAQSGTRVDVALPSQALTITGFDPQAVTTENADPDVVELPAATLVLTDYDIVANVSDPQVSQLDAETLDLTSFAPTINTTENANPNTSQLDAETLTLTKYSPQIFVSETGQDVSFIASASLTLVTHAPTVRISRRVIISS
jgi:hypothetical protein